MVDPIQRGRRWQAFYDEEGGIKDMLAEIRSVYLTRIAACDPNNTEGLRILALAHRVSVEFDDMIRSIIAGADVAEKAKEYTTRMQGLSPAARRRL